MIIDAEELVTRIVEFYDDFCPFDFVQDSSQGTHTSAVLDIARMTRTRSGVDDLIYNLSETLRIDILPELEAEPDVVGYEDYKETVEELIEDLKEYREQLPEKK